MPHSQQPLGGDRRHARISSAIDSWKRKLLDLTNRNRLLRFRVTKVSTIAVVDELPAEVFRLLCSEGRPMRFRAAPTRRDGEECGDATGRTTKSDSNSNDTEDATIDAAMEAMAGDVELMAYENGTAEDRHSDEWLQTTLEPEQLDRSLRRIEEQARLTVEEQGVNTLFLTLGMLSYTESADSDEVFRAPLVMLPVQLSRRSARTGYELSIGDDEPMINPALAERMRNRGITLLDLPESDAIGDNYDLQSYFVDLSDRIAGMERWSLTADIFLGFFSFQKFVMFKDLERHADAIAQHRLPRRLIGREGDNIVGLPDEIRTMELDAEYPPERTFQVVDADSSQLRAMAACARGYDVVIEGPPGTGKSQTITNLIAQGLAEGKSVLFVAEKMAALNVVHERLRNVGLGEFCLELHSNRANKRQVMRDLASTLDASFETIATTTAASQRLPAVRTALSDYVEALHSTHGTLGITPYGGFGELGAVRHAPLASLSLDVSKVTSEQLASTLRELEDVAAAARPIGNPATHTWRDSTRTFYTETDLDMVADQATSAATAASRLLSVSAELQSGFGLPRVQSLADVDAALKVGQVLAESPGAPLAVLQSDAWNTPPAAANRIIELGRNVSRLRTQVMGWFTADVLEWDHRDDIDFVRRKTSGAFGFLVFLDGRYRAIRKRWKSYRLSAYSKSVLAQADDLETVARLLDHRASLASEESQARELFGALWLADRSDWDALEAYVAWVVEFRRVCVSHGVQARAYDIAVQPSPDTSAFCRLSDAANEYRERLAGLIELVGWPAAYLQGGAVGAAAVRIQAIVDDVHGGPQWAAFERCRQTVAQGLAAELLTPMSSGALEPSALPAAFSRAFYTKWLTLAVKERPALEGFASLTHEQRVAEFKELDRRVLRENLAALVQKLRDAAQNRLREGDARSALPFLQQQMMRQRNISPLRRTMKQAGAAIRAIKPCFLMSPMTVAQLLDGSEPVFDLVIFDEASQLPTEDAIGAVIRGKQLVVVGDPKQLPPTNFFAVTTGQIAPQKDEDGNLLYDDSESILEELMGAGLPMSRLKWHYRSAHESLIRFSNVSFYDAELYTFPSLDSGTRAIGLQFEFIRDGRYEGSGLNLIEARRIADEVVSFARDQVGRQQRGDAPLSLGVGTFNMRQQIAIQDELERRRRGDPLIEEFFGRDMAEPFFVKNLENIQGDERDVIFISVTYGPSADGRIRYNFGPLNRENGWRRLNVLVTRARQRMRVFSSMRGEHINPAGATSDGPRLLREFLTFAEHGRLDGTTVAHGADTESLFERQVLDELSNRGLRVVPQVGTSGYRIDIGVLDDEVEGRFLCGIECDGAAYHSSETARDRDRLRQEVLEARGWTIHRVWSTDWFKDRRGQLDRLLSLIDADRVRALDGSGHAATASSSGETHAEIDEQSRHDLAPADTEPNPVRPARGLYTPPSLPTYIAAGRAGQFAGQDILTAPDAVLVRAVQHVIQTESPVHREEVLMRVAAMWSTRVGSRVRSRIEGACRAAARNGHVRRRGDFLWNGSDECKARSREGMRVPADRIAPEEYRAAVLTILGGGHASPRVQLVAEVRSALGFSRTGAHLEQAITTVFDMMLADGELGEGSEGLRLRQSAGPSDQPRGADGRGSTSMYRGVQPSPGLS